MAIETGFSLYANYLKKKLKKLGRGWGHLFEGTLVWHFGLWGGHLFGEIQYLQSGVLNCMQTNDLVKDNLPGNVDED